MVQSQLRIRASQRGQASHIGREVAHNRWTASLCQRERNLIPVCKMFWDLFPHLLLEFASWVWSREIYKYSKSRSRLAQTSSHSSFLTGVSESIRATWHVSTLLGLIRRASWWGDMKWEKISHNKCLLSLNGLESHNNSTRLVARLKISFTPENNRLDCL